MSEPELVLHMGLGKSKCRSCKKEIVWAFTEGGAKAPFERDDQGAYVLENGVARHVGVPTPQLELGAPAAAAVDRYTNHFARCKDSSHWRGRK